MKSTRTKRKTVSRATGNGTKKSKPAQRNGSGTAPKSLAALNRWLNQNQKMVMEEAEKNCVKLTGKKRF